MAAGDLVLPGKTIGILGGGQLGRMFAVAARRMGYRVHAFDPTSDCPTGQVADIEVNAPYDDLEAARRFAADVDVVTFEFENVPAQTLAEIEKIVPVHPSPQVLDTCRHRLREKEFLAKHGFPSSAPAPSTARRVVSTSRRIITSGISSTSRPCLQISHRSWRARRSSWRPRSPTLWKWSDCSRWRCSWSAIGSS